MESLAFGFQLNFGGGGWRVGCASILLSHLHPYANAFCVQRQAASCMAALCCPRVGQARRDHATPGSATRLDDGGKKPLVLRWFFYFRWSHCFEPFSCYRHTANMVYWAVILVATVLFILLSPGVLLQVRTLVSVIPPCNCLSACTSALYWIPLASEEEHPLSTFARLSYSFPVSSDSWRHKTCRIHHMEDIPCLSAHTRRCLPASVFAHRQAAHPYVRDGRMCLLSLTGWQSPWPSCLWFKFITLECIDVSSW